MSLEFYEVWARDEDDHEELVETTIVKKQALELAKKCLEDGYVAGIVYQEDDNGEPVEVQRFERG
jgi:hypothetical protein